MGKKIQIGVIFGGRTEHIGSIEHARAVIDCLQKNPIYEVLAIYITQAGAWRWLRDWAELPSTDTTSEVGIVCNGLIELVNPHKFIPLDFVFPLVLGIGGEDGALPGLLELAQIPYAGCGVLASALGMDKIVCKMMLDSHQLPHAPFCYTTREEWKLHPDCIFQQCKQRLSLPWFVKPANSGSSIGISRVDHYQEFDNAMQEAGNIASRILIEQAILPAREIEVAIMGNDSLQVSMPGEITHTRPFFDYRAKYHDTDTKILVPPPNLPSKVLEDIQMYAQQVYRLLNCCGFARIDFLVHAHTHKIFILEINTIPGLTPARMFPQLWQAQGYSYPQILDTLISLGFEKKMRYYS